MAFLRSSGKFVRNFAGVARNFVFNNGREYEVQVQQPHCICNATQGFATIAKTSQNLENSLKRLDQDVRRSGRISRRDIEEILDEIRTNKSATSSQSLLVIRCCGNLVPEELPEIRTSLVKEIWRTLDNLNVPMDISHYNALLRVYLENEHQFSPTEFLADLQSKGVEPNRVTYQRLISRYCQLGEIDGATQILEYMREKQLPVNENVFNALIMGHSQADDMESASGILTVMTQAGLEPSADTYTTLMCGYARKGDIAEIDKTLAICETKDILLLDKDILEIIYALTTNGHADKVDPVMGKIRKMAGYNQDAVNVILRLINKGHEETALKILKTMPRGSRPDGELIDTGNFLIKQLVKANRPAAKVLEVCKDLEESKLNARPLFVAVEAAITNGLVDIAPALLQQMKEMGYELRQHYFWPLICSAGQKSQQDVIKVVDLMYKDFGLSPSGETIRDYIIPSLNEKDYDKLIQFLRNGGISIGNASTSTAHYALTNNDLKKAAEIASSFNAYYSPGLFRRPLLNALSKTKDYQGYISFVRQLYDSIPRLQNINKKEGLDEEEGDIVTSNAGQAEVLGQIVLDAAQHFKVDRVVVLQKILEGLVEQGLSISNNQAEKIQEQMGESLTADISTLLGKLSTGELEPIEIAKGKMTSAMSMDVDSLERMIKNLDDKGENTKGLKRQLLVVSIRNKDVPKTEELIGRLEADGFILTSGVYAQLIDLYTSTENIDGAIKTYNKIKVKEPDFVLDDTKTIKLAQAYVNNDRLDDAKKFLEENKKEVVSEERGFNYNTTCWRLLNGLAEKGKVEETNQMFDCMVANNYITPTNVLLGPLIKVHIVNNDLKTAVEKFEEVSQKHRATPWKNELACRLIQAEDAASLQKLTDLSTDIHGEVNSLYDLVFSFVECGRIRQARKILETPGLRTRPQRINSACERYRQEGLVLPLEGLMEATKDLNHIDRGEICYSLLLSYIKDVQPDKALGLWTKMQEEDIAPNDQFMRKLGDFLKSQNIDVPFTMPEVKVGNAKQQNKNSVSNPVPAKKQTKDVKPSIVQPIRSVSEGVTAVKVAIKSGDVDQILSAKAKLSSNDKLSNTDQSLVVEALVKGDRLREASKLVEEMLSQGNQPISRIFRFYLNKIAASGDVSQITKLSSQISSESKKLLSFDNRTCHAYIVAGKSEQYLKELENAIDQANTDSEIKDVGEKFPRGGAVGILEELPQMCDHFEVIATKYAKKGLLAPMNVLWMHKFISGDEESAKRLWKDHLAEAPRLMFQRIVHLAREKQDSNLVQRLIDLLKHTKVSAGAIGNAYSSLLDILSTKNQFDEALKVLDAAIHDVCLENINRTALLRIKEGAEKTGLKFPHNIPEKSTNGKPNIHDTSSSSASSSSDDEVTARH